MLQAAAVSLLGLPAAIILAIAKEPASLGFPHAAKEQAMTSEGDSCGASHEALASRREFVAAVTVATATNAAAGSRQ